MVKSLLRMTALALSVLLMVQLVRGMTPAAISQPSLDTSPQGLPVLFRIGDTLPNVTVWEIHPSGRPSKHLLHELPPVIGCWALLFYSADCGWCQEVAKAWALLEDSIPAWQDRPPVLWISVPDEPKAVQQFATSFELPTPHFVLGGIEDALALGLVQTPTVYVVDQGFAIHRLPGGFPSELLVPRPPGGTGSFEVGCRPTPFGL